MTNNPIGFQPSHMAQGGIHQPASHCPPATYKPKWQYMPIKPVELAVAAFEHGASKYKPYGWRETGYTEDDVLDKIQRHLVGLRCKDYIDSESGLHHIAHLTAEAIVYADLFVTTPNRPEDNE